ncbi:acyl-CoA thioesterase [Nocardia pseudovaccinii]|uniref:acyl-CoA thioesterase n=1 Tax=Nocardia pseudovaccinii TaxID=189540 RepID=UPI0007A4DDF9|nr:acyl-CoA thioesterase domain-containing protein [Nocardia pseudovaccinii]
MSEMAMSTGRAGLRAAPLTEVLELERIDRGFFRSVHRVAVERPLYGGQVLAQALMACGATVDADRLPHSLHGYFLRKGNSATSVMFRVENDRDGRSYSARRVVALQDGEVIFSMAASFRAAVAGEEHTTAEVLPVRSPEQCLAIDPRPELALQVRVQDWSSAEKFFPARFWVRPNCALPQGEPLVHAAAIAYMSDFSTGLRRRVGTEQLGPSLDHALWFHRLPRWDDWIFVDHRPGVSAGMRGWYPGTIVHNGHVVASLVQEMAYSRGS